MPAQHKVLENYLDLAIKNQLLKNDSHLAKALGIHRATMSAYRHGKAWPSPDTMAKIAKLANLNAEMAILDLGIWANEGPSKSIYMHIAERLTATAAVVLLLISVAVTGVGSPSPVTTVNRA